MEFNSSRSSAMSAQLKVFQNGRWKIRYGRADSHGEPNTGEGNNHHHFHPMANPWIQHFSPVCRPQAEASLPLQGPASLGSTSQRSHLRMKKVLSCELANSSKQLHHASPVADFMSTKWTDEIHKLYIEYMETSFVKQYSCASMDDNLQDSISSERTHYTSTISGQIFQGGCWREICYETSKPPPSQGKGKDEHQFRALAKTPWIQRFIRTPIKREGIAPSSLQRSSGPYRKFEEMSGQNFDGDDIGENQADLGSICNNKKMKTITTDSINIQAISSSRSLGREDVQNNSTSAVEKDASNSDEKSSMAAVI